MNSLKYNKGYRTGENFGFQVTLESIFICVVYCVCIIGFHHLNIIKMSQYEIYNNAMQIVSSYKASLDDEIMDEIRSDTSVENVIPVSIEKTLLNKNIQRVPVSIIGTDNESLKILMDKYSCELISGRLPENNEEVLLSESVARGKEIKLNQYIKDGRKAVGIIKSPYLVNFRYIDNEITSKLKQHCVLIVFKDGKELSEDILNEAKSKGYNVISKKECGEDTKPITYSLILIMLFILFLFLGSKIVCCRCGRGIKEKGKKEFQKHILASIFGILIGIFIGKIYNVFIESRCGIEADLINISFIVISICISVVSYIINKILFIKGKKYWIKET